MGKGMLRAALAVGLLALCVVGVAEAQQGAGLGVRRTGNLTWMGVAGAVPGDTLWYPLPLSSGGESFASREVSPDREYVRDFGDVFATATTLAVLASDSTVAINVSAYRHLKLLVYITPGATAALGNITQVAFRLDECADGQVDSASVFAEYRTRQVPAAATTDTLRFGHMSVGSTTTPFGNEFVVQIDSRMQGQGMAGFRGGAGISIPIDRVFGTDTWFRYLRIKMTNLAGVACAIRVRLIGTAL